MVCLDVVLVVFGEVGYEGRVKLVWDGIMNKDLGVFKFCFVYYFVFFERVFKVVLYLLYGVKLELKYYFVNVWVSILVVFWEKFF